MKFQVYILYSEKIDSFYKGQTSNLTDRLYRHNHRYEKATKAGAPWKLIWTSEKPSRSEALSLERKLKNLSVKRTLLFILKYSQGIPSSDELLMIQKLSELSVSLMSLRRSEPNPSPTFGYDPIFVTKLSCQINETR